MSFFQFPSFDSHADALFWLRDKLGTQGKIPLFVENALAYLAGSFASRMQATGRESFNTTVSSRWAATQQFAGNDYRLRWKIPGQVEVTVNIDPALTVAASYTALQENLWANFFPPLGETDRQPTRAEARDNLVFEIGEDSKTQIWYLQTTRAQATTGTYTTGLSYQRVELPYIDVITDTLALTIDGDVYEPRETLVFSTAADRHFTHEFREDGTSFVTLGFIDEIDGDQYGTIPLEGKEILIDCAVGGGSEYYVKVDELQYGQGDENVISISNLDSQLSADAETVDNARRLAAQNARSHGLFWDIESGIVQALQVVGVINASIILHPSLAWTMSVYVMPVGGGVAPQNLLDAVEARLLERSAFEQVDIGQSSPYFPGNGSVESMQYTDFKYAASIKMKAGYSFTDWEIYIRMALAARCHEAGFWLQDRFVAKGVTGAVEVYNDAMGYLLDGVTVTTDQHGAWISANLGAILPQASGESIYLQDLQSVAIKVARVDYSLPAEFQDGGGGPVADPVVAPGGGFVHPVEFILTEI